MTDQIQNLRSLASMVQQIHPGQTPNTDLAVNGKQIIQMKDQQEKKIDQTRVGSTIPIDTVSIRKK